MIYNLLPSKAPRPFNRKMFNCLRPAFWIPQHTHSVAYASYDTLFFDTDGNQRPLNDFYCTESRVLCPHHPLVPAVGYVFEEYSCTTGFYCPHCKVTTWLIGPHEMPCAACGIPLHWVDASVQEICPDCGRYPDTVSGTDFSTMEVAL
ncbi:hypothetical protein [Burkholderia oklahomensis]|uniref:Uncharacterized protein n=1 Tax=Burkholderia oklahomensis TaxID=342113 RepID=A0AAI8B546_9BURK|nr:hypothetical protein [Burkholderia oklahomensis]AIO65848.1 hypothetical protein DM82_2284 [Burkholderia oklahomensis]QPS36290.1 hypothetical protein I6G57_13170 [Burkholderia oklahomensis]